MFDALEIFGGWTFRVVTTSRGLTQRVQASIDKIRHTCWHCRVEDSVFKPLEAVCGDCARRCVQISAGASL